MKYVSKKARLNKIFIDAACWDQPEKAFIAMVKGADMNTVTPENGYNAFHWAIHNISANMLKVLIDYKSSGYERLSHTDLSKELIEKYADKFGGTEKLYQKWKAQTKLLDLNHVNYDRKIARDCYPRHLSNEWYKSKKPYLDKFTRLLFDAESIARERFAVARNLSYLYKDPEKIDIIHYKDYEAL